MTFEDFKNVLEQYPDLSFDTFSGYYMKKDYTPEAQVCCWIEEDKCVKFFKKIYRKVSRKIPCFSMVI